MGLSEIERSIVTMMRLVLLLVIALFVAGLLPYVHPVHSQEGSPTASEPISSVQQKGNQPQEDIGTLRRDVRDLQIHLSTSQTAIGDLRNLSYIIISVLFAIILGFLGLVAWLETKTRAATKRLEEASASAIAAFAARADEHVSLYESRLKDITGRYLSSKVLQDLVLSGKVLYWTGKPDEAVATLSEAVVLAPEDAEARKYRGLAFRRLGVDQLKAAIIDLEYAASSELFRLDPETHFALAASYMTARQWGLALDQAQRTQAAGYKNSEEIQTMIADALKGKGAIAEAETLYTTIIERNPRCTPAIVAKGGLLSLQRRYDDVVALYTNAIRERAGVSNYHVYRAVALARRNKDDDWERALSDFSAAEKLSPSDWYLWYWRGRLHVDRALARSPRGISSDDPDIISAINYLEGGIRNAKKAVTPMYRNHLCRIFLLLGKGEQALAEAKKSVEAGPGFVQNHMVLATACLALKRWPQAITAAEDGLKASRAPPGRIWCTYFVIYSRCFQRYEDRQLKAELSSLTELLATAPYFDASGWDFEHVDHSNAEEIEQLPESIRHLLDDTRKALNQPEIATATLSRWL